MMYLDKLVSFFQKKYLDTDTFHKVSRYRYSQEKVSRYIFFNILSEKVSRYKYKIQFIVFNYCIL